MKIDSSAFGSMTIGGAEYTTDLIIYPDGRVVDQWWRSQGHVLLRADIEELIAAAPSVIVCGTGMSGVMKPEPGLADALADKGIEFRPLQTPDAVALYNSLKDEGGIGACFHLTC